MPGVDIRADKSQEQAEDNHADGVQQRPLGQNHRRDQPQDHQGKIIGRTELEANSARGKQYAERVDDRNRAYCYRECWLLRNSTIINS